MEVWNYIKLLSLYSKSEPEVSDRISFYHTGQTNYNWDLHTLIAFMSSMSGRKLCTVLVLIAVWLVLAGHKKLAETHQTVADGWKLFKEPVEGAGARDLPHLLCIIEAMVTPSPLTIPMEVPETWEAGSGGKAITPTLPTPSPIKRQDENIEEPVVIRINEKRKWACPQCNFVIISQRGCYGHIREKHTGKTYVCSMCNFSSYNLDSLHKHEREHN